MDQKDEVKISSGQCFGCAFSFLSVLLDFINQTSSVKEFLPFYLEENFVNTLYTQNLKFFSAKIRGPARNAICKIIYQDAKTCTAILDKVELNLQPYLTN